jgi:hypothetical protein
MNPKSPFAPFSFSPAPLFAGAAANPFLPSQPSLDETPAPAVDAVWCQDSGDDADESALPTAEAVDVRILWGTNVLHFEQMSPPRPFTLGGAGSDFTLPETASAGASASYSLVRLSGSAGAERATVLVAADATVEVRLVNGSVLTLMQCLEKGLAQPAADEGGAHEILLPHGATATVRIAGSELEFEVSRGRARGKPETGFLAGADLSGQIYTGLSALAHATLVGALAFFLPAMHNDDAESIDRNAAAAMMPYLNAIAEREPEPVETVVESGPSAPSGGGSGSQAEGPSGKLGATVAQAATSGRYALAGDTKDPQLARRHELEMAATFGILNILSGDPANAPVAAWGADYAAGHDPRSANGGMWEQNINDALGVGGLGMSGTEEGGGGFAHGIGIDGIGSTIGHGTGDIGGDGPGRGPGHDFGPGGSAHSHAGPLGGHVPTGPRLTPSPITTFNGTLPKEVVQRIVRQNFGRFRLCYEAGLRANPGLTGRVSVAFVIDRNGNVAVASADKSTDMADQNVVSCVVRGFQNLSFPEPKDGTVQVIYPLMLAPGE